MNILMLAPEPFFQPRGTPISVYFRLKALSDLGHRTVLVTYPLGEDVALPGLLIRRISNFLRLRRIKIGPSAAKIPLDALMFFAALRELRKNRFDLIFSHEEAAWIGVLLGRWFGVPHLYDMHSSLPQQLENFNFSKSRFLKKIFLALERAVLKRSRAVIVICRDLLEYVAKKGFGEKAIFLENFMDFADFENEPMEAGLLDQKRREIAPGGEKIVLYAGNFEPYQGVPLLVEAFARVESKAVLLLVGGSKAEHEAMREKARALGAAERVVFVEKVPPRRVSLYLAIADILVSPRVSGTNTPLKIYAFLKSGKPLVATNLWTHTQVVDETIAILAAPEPQGLAEGIAFALHSDEAQARARKAKSLANCEYVYPKYLDKIREALSKTVS
jgi:glycosyltransferase involved in cell wall biosynthesis